jgi:hypothetical protein
MVSRSSERRSPGYPTGAPRRTFVAPACDTSRPPYGDVFRSFYSDVLLSRAGRLGECQGPGGLAGRVGEHARGWLPVSISDHSPDTGYRRAPRRSQRSRLNASHWSNQRPPNYLVNFSLLRSSPVQCAWSSIIVRNVLISNVSPGR